MRVYGSDKPDLRPGMLIADVSALFAESPFGPFRDAVTAGGVVRGFVVSGGATSSRKELDDLAEQARQLGASGLVWVKLAQAAVQSSALKIAGEAPLRQAFDAAGGGEGDLLLLAAGDDVARRARARPAAPRHRANGTICCAPTTSASSWVTEFPLFEWNADEQRWDSMHHPFTSPRPQDVALLESAPGGVRARAYDLALNGSEIAGGSIRIHRADVQRQVFRLLGISDEDARARFGFFLDALEYGTPPHGGIAFGLDRIVSLICGEASIREVIAFPKTAQAVDLMAGAPSPVDERQLRELHIRIRD